METTATMTDAPKQPPVARANMALAAIAVVAALYWARDLLIPIALAIFFAFLLAPPVRRIQRWGVSRLPAVLVMVALTFSFLAVGGCFVGSRAMSFVEQLPQYRDNIVERARALRESIGGTIQPLSQTIDAVVHEMAGPTPTHIAENARQQETPAENTAPPEAVPSSPVTSMVRLIRTALVPLLHPILTFALSAVFVVFFLTYQEDLRDRFVGLCGDGKVGVTTTAISEVGERISRYFDGLVLTNCLNGAAIALGLTLLDVPDALLFGVLAALLRFVPFLGTWIAAILPIALSLAIFQGWTLPVLVALLFIVVDQVSANVVEPWFYGTRTGASPTAIILSMVVWSWLWGAVGLLLSTPITVCLVVLGKYVPRFQYFYLLLGDQPVLQPHVRLYQHLLVMDQEEAVRIVEKSAPSGIPEEAFSDVVVPALSLMAGDHRRDASDTVREEVVRQVVNRLLDRFVQPETGSDPAANETPPKTQAPSDRCATAMLISAHGPYDEIGATILARLFEARGGSVRAVSPHLLIAEMLDELRADPPQVVCLFSLQSDHISRMELLCRRIHGALPDASLVVGVWEPAVESIRLQRRFGRFPRARLCRTLTATLSQLRTRLHLKPDAEAPSFSDEPRKGLRRFWRTGRRGEKAHTLIRNAVTR